MPEESCEMFNIYVGAAKNSHELVKYLKKTPKMMKNPLKQIESGE